MKLFLSLAAALALLLSAPVAQAQDCKGQVHEACITTDECQWVRGYVTKKGTEVQPYCRSRPRVAVDLPEIPGPPPVLTEDDPAPPDDSGPAVDLSCPVGCIPVPVEPAETEAETETETETEEETNDEEEDSTWLPSFLVPETPPAEE